MAKDSYPAKPTLPEVFPLAKEYCRKNPGAGSLHIVLEDENVADSNVDFCIAHAEGSGDVEGARLARLLRAMSRTQRLRLSQMLYG